jgi:predicted ATPase
VPDPSPKVQDPVLLVEAHFALGLILLMRGEFTPAREHLEQEVAICDLQQHRPFALLYGQDPQVTSLSLAAWALWFLGYPDRALQRSEEALTLARELSHPYSLAYALISAAWLHQYRREEQRVQERVEAVIALCTEQGFPFWLPYGTILRGWVLAEQGQGEEGIALIQQGLAAVWATGTELGWSYNLALLAEAHGRVGQIKKGFSALAEALTVVNKTGERRYEAELYRLKGQLTLQKFQVSGSKFQVPPSPQHLTPNPRAEAEACFLKAVEIARKQQAKSLELRAVMSLARLWQQQGKKAEARQMLAEIYGWFTEGFDTADLRDAEVLLKKLV